MKNGELFEGDTLNRVWPDAKPLPPLWWWGDEEGRRGEMSPGGNPQESRRVSDPAGA